MPIGGRRKKNGKGDNDLLIRAGSREKQHAARREYGERRAAVEGPVLVFPGALGKEQEVGQAEQEQESGEESAIGAPATPTVPEREGGKEQDWLRK